MEKLRGIVVDGMFFTFAEYSVCKLNIEMQMIKIHIDIKP